MRTLPIWIAIGALLGVAGAAEKKVQMKDLPPAVQKTVQDQTKGAEIRGISSETEKGTDGNPNGECSHDAIQDRLYGMNRP